MIIAWLKFLKCVLKPCFQNGFKNKSVFEILEPIFDHFLNPNMFYKTQKK